MSKSLQFIIIWGAIVFLIFFSLQHDRISKKLQKIIIVILILIFSYMYSYRTLGLDLRNYISFYEEASITSLMNQLSFDRLFSNRMEPIYTIWTYISKKSELTFQESTFFYILVAMFFNYRLICKTEYPLISYMLLMLMLMFRFDLIRMVLALPLAMTAYFEKNKFKKSFFYILAFCSQYSSILLLLYEFSARIMIKKNIIIKKYVVFFSLFIILIKIVLKHLKSYPYRILIKIDIYLNSKQSFELGVFYTLFIFLTCAYVVFLGCFLINKISKINSFNNINISIKSNNDLILYSNVLKIGVSLSIVMIFINLRAASRIMLPAIYPYFLILSKQLGDKIVKGHVKKDALTFILLVMLDNVITSLYYLWTAIKY